MEFWVPCKTHFLKEHNLTFYLMFKIRRYELFSSCSDWCISYFTCWACIWKRGKGTFRGFVIFLFDSQGRTPRMSQPSDLHTPYAKTQPQLPKILILRLFFPSQYLLDFIMKYISNDSKAITTYKLIEGKL